MKIVQVITQMEAGGAQKVAHLLHEGLRERGHETHLVFLYTKRPAYAECRGVRSLFERPPSAASYLTIFDNLWQDLQQSPPDVLISHTHYANVMAQVAGCLTHVPVRIAVHHNPLNTYPKAARAADYVLGQTGAYSRVIAVSDAVEDTLRDLPARYTKLVHRIYNGLPRPDFELKDMRAAWNIPTNKPLVLNVGRLSHQKNQATLLRAISQLPETHLAVVGDGELSGTLQQHCKELNLQNRVHFTGELPTGDVYSFFATADAFAFPSIFESMGLAVVEAMQMALPIVAADLPAMHEVLQHAALFVAPHDAASLAASLRRLLCDRDLASDFGLQAKKRAEVFSSEAMVDEYNRIIMHEAQLAHKGFWRAIRPQVLNDRSTI